MERVLRLHDALSSRVQLVLEALHSLGVVAHGQIHVLVAPLERLDLGVDQLLVLELVCFEFCNLVLHYMKDVLVPPLFVEHGIVELARVGEAVLEPGLLLLQRGF